MSKPKIAENLTLHINNTEVHVKHPSLTDTQKAEMKALIDAYLSNSAKFVYDGTFRRESYAYPQVAASLDNANNIQGCVYGGKYILNCGLFAQMIWMGRSYSDFASTTSIKKTISKAFSWGYYFDFKAARLVYGVTKSDGNKYAGNTYTSNGTKYFITFDNAAAMAQELYTKGYEIPYSEVEVGDLVFYRADDISDGSTDALEQSSFRHITHVGIVYDIVDGNPIIAESTNAFAAAVGKSGLARVTGVSELGRTRGAGYAQKVVMAARHPAAYGEGGNVPSSFSLYRGVDA